MSLIMVKCGGYISKLIVVVLVFCAVLTNEAMAISRLGPDPSEFNLNAPNVSNANRYESDKPNGANAKYVVAKSDNTGDQSTIHIPVYYTGITPPASVNLSVYGMVRGDYSGSSQRQYLSVNGSEPFFGGTEYISLSGFVWDPVVGLWSKDVSVVLRNGDNNNTPISFYHNRLSFRLSLPSGGSWLIGNGGGGDRFNVLAANPAAGQNKGYNYAIQFATPCTLTANTQGDIRLYDLDSGLADNEYRDITVSVRDVTNGGNSNQPVTTHGSMGDAGTYRLTMTFELDHIYKLRIRNVSPINLVQYRLPYDGVNFVTGCPVMNYSLTPTVSLSPNASLEAGANLTANLSVNNSGPTPSDPADWRLTRSVNAGAGVAVSSSSSKVTFQPGTPASPGLPSYSDIDTDIAPGSRICYVLSVKPYSSSSGEVWRDSSPACVTVGKKPKIQIWGGDLRVGSGTDIRGTVTSTSNKTIDGAGRTFGSWVEYAIFATGSISGTASGSAFAKDGALTVAPGDIRCRYSTLSFTNVPLDGAACTGAEIGNYSNAGSIPNVASSFPGGSPLVNPNPIDPNSLLADPGTYIGIASSDINIAGSTLASGKSVIIKALNNTVTITGDIQYADGPYTKAKDIPQLVIIAKNINITDNVTRIDAWLIAKDGNINTCSTTNDGVTPLPVDSNLSVNICSKPLHVDGPVMANKLYLRRTAGSGTGANSGDPAEIFNLRADAYLWAYSRASGTGRIQTVYTTDLPPRY